MKRLMIIALAVSLSGAAFAQNAPAERTARLQQSTRELANNPYKGKNALAAGADLLYGTEIESMGIGLKFHWMITRDFRLAPNASFWFEHDNMSSWDINVDLHYVIGLNNRWSVYPLAGLTVSTWDPKHGSSDTNFGVNFGVGAEFDITRQWFLNFDFKYRLISDYDQAVLGLGFGYRF